MYFALGVVDRRNRSTIEDHGEALTVGSAIRKPEVLGVHEIALLLLSAKEIDDDRHLPVKARVGCQQVGFCTALHAERRVLVTGEGREVLGDDGWFQRC